MITANFNTGSILFLFFQHEHSLAQNPIVRDQFSADPAARVFGDRVYVFPLMIFLLQKAKEELAGFAWKIIMYSLQSILLTGQIMA
jgi:hypothetical protein